MSHTHGPEEWRKPCRFKTKKACDENFTQFTHGHMGTPCVKDFQESKSKKGRMNSIATCTIIVPQPEGLSFEAGLAIQVLAAPESWRAERSREVN